MKTFFMMPLAIFLIILIIMMAKLLDKDAQEESALIGQPLPTFNLPAVLEDTPGLKNTDITGEYSIVNIFASWCLPCKIEHQFLMQLSEQGVLIYGINWKDKAENIRPWFEKKGNPYRAIGADKEGKTIVDLGVTGAPESFLISPEGIIIYRYAGILTQEIWNEKILPKME